MVSVARWLDTFTCSKYADRFERLGYSTLQSICQLNSIQLQNLGVSPPDIYTIMENVLLLKQSVNSLNSPRYFDLNSEPPPSFEPDIVNSQLPSTSFNDFPPQQSMTGMMYREDLYDTPPQRFYSSNQQQFVHLNQRIIRTSLWPDQQQFPHSNIIVPHPLESLERLVHLPESQVIDPKSIVNELSNSDSLSNPPIVSNLLTNGLKRCLSNDEPNELNKKSRLKEDSVVHNHPVVTSLLTRNLNNSISQTLLPSITSLQQKHTLSNE